MKFLSTYMKLVMKFSLFLILLACQKIPQNGSPPQLPSPTKSGMTPNLTTLPVPTAESTTEAIYISLTSFNQQQKLSQIWEIAGMNSSKVYEQENISIFSPIIPSNIFKNVENYIGETPQEIKLKDVFFNSNLRKLQLSPNKKHLAFIEDLSWSPDSAVTPLPFSFNRVVNIDLETGLATEIVLRDSIEGFHWISNSQIVYRGFEEMKFKHWRVDLVSKQVELINDFSEILGENFSPDGKKFAYFNEPQLGKWQVIICSTEDSNNCQNVDNNWYALSHLSWKPQSNILSVTGQTNRPSDDIQPVFLIDAETLFVSLFPAQTAIQFLHNPKWSPDGKYLATNASDIDRLINHLLVFQDTGELQSDFSSVRDRVDMWQWSDNSQTILVLLGSSPNIKQGVGLLNPVNGQIQLVSLPKEIQNALDKSTISINWVTW